MAEHFGNDAPNNRLAEQSSPPADRSMGHENQADRSTARDIADEFDTLVALLRQPAPSDMFSKESACQRAVEAIRQLGRTPNASELGPAGSTDDELPALRALGQYQLLEKMGEGGMGAVYRALHTRLEKVVAVKVLPAGRVGDAEAIARFSREMKAVGRLDHPNIVRAFDAGEADGSHYLVMELVDGHDLGAIVRRIGPLPVADACEAVRQAALGLDHAHSHGLVHRDVKPSNLMLTRQGEVKILDLGLARLADQIPGGKELTSTGQMMGTFEYMAPEQGSDSHAVDHRADVYALGATLYKLLAGHAPFAGSRYDTPLKRMMALATEDPEPIRQTRPDVPKGLARLIHRMLARDPDHRTATAHEVADLLAPFAAGADLAGLVARADEASPAPAVEPGTASTQPAAASAMEHTPHTIQISSPAAFRPQASRLRRLAAWFGNLPPVARFGLTAAAGAAGLVLLAVILTVRTPQGTLVVESDDPNIEVLVKQNGEVIDILSADRGWKVGLKDGRYDVALTAGAERMQLSENQVTLTRGGRVVLRVIKKAGPLIAPSVAPYVDGDWVRLINRMSDCCIGVKDASADPRAPLHQYKPAPGALQQHWRIESTDRPGMYRLKNRKSGLYVTLKQPRQGEGYLQRPFEEDNSEFLFSILDIDGKWFRIVSQESKLDAAIWGASMREGEWIIQWPFSVGATDKYWRMEHVDEASEHGWVDVLAQMNPDKHGVFGAWRRDGSRLVCEPLDFTRIGSPVYATGNYEVEAHFRWINKVGEVNLLLPVGDSAIHVWVKPGSGAIGQFSGSSLALPAKTRTYEADHRYTLAATVRVDGATATIETRMDGEPYAKWSGPVESLYPRSDWMVPNRTLGFGAHVCHVSLEGLRVRPLTGGRLFRKTYRAEPAGVEPGQSVELAALVDPARHAVLGKWEVADGVITCVESREFARVAIPLVPRGDYELSGALLRPKGLSLATLAIPVGRSYTGLEIKDKAVVLERVVGSPPWKRADVQMGPETQFEVRVEHQGDIAKIHVAIDGKPALDWEGPTGAGQPRFDWVFNPPSLGVGTHSGALAVKDLKIKLLSGTAERIVENVEPIPDSQSAVGQSGSLFPAASGTVRLVHHETGRGLFFAEMGHGSPATLAQRPVQANNGTAVWQVEAATEGRFRLKNLETGLYLVSENRERDAHVVQRPLEKDNADFVWKSEQVHSGLLRVANQRTGYYLTASAADAQQTSLLTLGAFAARSASQYWRLEPVEPTAAPFPAEGTAEEQKAWVVAELKRLNPEYDGDPRFAFAEGDIVRVELRGRKIRDLRPFAPLRKLRVLLCNDSSVSDISPLAGMPLEELRLYGSRVSDFGPLKGMPLKTADLCHASVGDLSPLAGLPLETLGLYGVQAIDFSPLKGMALKDLNVGSTRFSDLSLLKGMPLETLCILNTPIRDLTGLKGLPLKSLTCHSTQISDLSPLAGMSLISLSLLNTPVEDLSPLTGMPLRYLGLDGTRVADLSPLKGIPLEKFQMANTLISDLSPLAGSPLRWLTCNGTPVKDFSPLKDTPLLSISCDVRPEDAAALRQIRTLKTINDRPAADVLREAEETLKQADVPERPESRSERLENPSGEPPKDTASASEKPADAPKADDKSARGGK